MMKKIIYFKNIVLAAEMCFLCTAVILLRTFLPGTVLPRLSIPMLTVLAVIPMIIGNGRKGSGEDNRMLAILLAGLTFAFLPFCAGWSGNISFWKIFVVGAAVYGITDLFYSSVRERGFAGWVPPITNGFLLWLASQCFQGML